MIGLCSAAARGAETAAPAPAAHPARREFYLGDLPIETPALPAALADWLGGRHVLGDLGGLRPWLGQLGITPSLALVVDVQGNPIGGARRGLREFNDLGLDVEVDLARSIGLAGARLHVSASWRSGTSLSNLDVGNVFNVAQACCGATFRLVDVYYEQSVLEGRLSMRAGRSAAGDEFMTSRGR